MKARDGSKFCSACKRTRKAEFFSKNRRAPDGLQAYCKECVNKRQATPEFREYMRRYKRKRRTNPVYRKAEREYSTSPKRLEAQRLYKKKWRTEHRELVAEGNKARRKKSKKKIAAQKKIYRAVRDGKIRRPSTCSKADNTCRGDTQAHHLDYDKPFEVVWLCMSHHQREHLDDL